MKAKNSIYVKKNTLFYLELSSRDLSDRQSREKATKPLQYVSHAQKLEGNVWIPSVLCWSVPHFQNGGLYREKVYLRLLLPILLINAMFFLVICTTLELL